MLLSKCRRTTMQRWVKELTSVSRPGGRELGCSCYLIVSYCWRKWSTNTIDNAIHLFQEYLNTKSHLWDWCDIILKPLHYASAFYQIFQSSRQKKSHSLNYNVQFHEYNLFRTNSISCGCFLLLACNLRTKVLESQLYRIQLYLFFII